MSLNDKAGCAESDAATEQELELLYKRLSTIDKLIHSIEQYDRYRQVDGPLHTEKTA